MREIRSSRAKKSERTWIEDFHEWRNLAGCSRTSGVTRVHAPAAEIFKEISKYFEILPKASSFFLMGCHRPANIYNSLHTTLLLRERKLGICYFVKGEASSLSPRKIILNPLCLCYLYVLCVFSVHGWIVSLLSLGCYGVRSMS